jgi:hypothetical protein
VRKAAARKSCQRRLQRWLATRRSRPRILRRSEPSRRACVAAPPPIDRRSFAGPRLSPETLRKPRFGWTQEGGARNAIQYNTIQYNTRNSSGRTARDGRYTPGPLAGARKFCHSTCTVAEHARHTLSGRRVTASAAVPVSIPATAAQWRTGQQHCSRQGTRAWGSCIIGELTLHRARDGSHRRASGKMARVRRPNQHHRSGKRGKTRRAR